MSGVIAKIHRLFRPPRVVALTRRPAGWLAVGRRQLVPVVAWARLEDDQVVPLVADRRGLRPAVGRKFRGGYLPGAARSPHDVQLARPAVSVPAADLEEAIGPLTDSLLDAIYSTGLPNETEWRELDAVYNRLQASARDEWAIEAVCSFVAEPRRFLRRHLALIVEHAHAAELDPTERAFLASLTAAPDPERTSTGGDHA